MKCLFKLEVRILKRFLASAGQLLLIWLAIVIACGVGALFLAASDALLGQQSQYVRTMT